MKKLVLDWGIFFVVGKRIGNEVIKMANVHYFIFSLVLNLRL